MFNTPKYHSIMFEELRKVYASLKKAKDEAAKRRDDLQSKYEEFKSTVKSMWQEAALQPQKFKLKNGELAVSDKDVSIATSGCGLTNELLEEAAAQVSDYLAVLADKYDATWTR